MQSISKGRDVSSLYPSVAKLVVSSNTEIKKLVYTYLVHFAETEPEAALLAINTLKKELGNTNQLARANALRTMSSIRVRIIAQLIAQAVKKAATDSSPYVRKTAAHAVTKLAEYVRISIGPTAFYNVVNARVSITHVGPLCVHLSAAWTPTRKIQ